MLEITEVKQMELTDYMDIKMEIKKNLTGIVSSFNVVGFYLKHIKERKLYVEEGYKDVWEFAYAEFKLDRTAAGRFMRINDRYSVDGNSLELQEQFKGFSKSTLTEMLSLPEEDYELITEDTKVSDIRELKKAEEEQNKEEEQIPGQNNIVSMMPDVVPDAEKPVEVDVADALRDIFRPKERKEQLDALVNMDPDSSAMTWWVEDFNSSGNLMLRKIPYFMFFYPLQEGVKIKNIKTGEIKSYTYKDFYFMVRAAFHQETVRGTDVWNQAFGAEYEAEQQRLKEEEERKREEEKRKQELQKQQEEKQRAIKENQEKMASEEAEKEVLEQNEGEAAAALNKIKGNSDFSNDNSDRETQTGGNETETPEIVTGTVEQEDENSVCDIAQIPESAIMTSLERAKWVKSHISSPRESHAVTVDADTYQDIITGWKRFIVLEYKAVDGDTLTIYNGENKPIEAIVINYEHIEEGNGVHISGFEVISHGQEE